MKRRTLGLATFALAALSLGAALPAGAVEVGGATLPDTASVAGQALLLNGAGVRTRLFFKVYAMGLYLTRKASSTDEVLKSEGARRVTLHLLRKLSGEDFAKAFTEGLNNNTSEAERQRLADPIRNFVGSFASQGDLKEGDLIHMDWVPGTGLVATVNGKPVGEPIADPSFYNAVLRIWLGDKPADSDLKPLLLGGK
jgi:hypothetical protein